LPAPSSAFAGPRQRKPTGPGPPSSTCPTEPWSRQRVCGIVPPVMTGIRVTAQTLTRQAWHARWVFGLGRLRRTVFENQGEAASQTLPRPPGLRPHSNTSTSFRIRYARTTSIVQHIRQFTSEVLSRLFTMSWTSFQPSTFIVWSCLTENRLQFCVGRLECHRKLISGQTDVEHQAYLNRKFGDAT